MPLGRSAARVDCGLGTRSVDASSAAPDPFGRARGEEAQRQRAECGFQRKDANDFARRGALPSWLCPPCADYGWDGGRRRIKIIVPMRRRITVGESLGAVEEPVAERGRDLVQPVERTGLPEEAGTLSRLGQVGNLAGRLDRVCDGRRGFRHDAELSPGIAVDGRINGGRIPRRDVDPASPQLRAEGARQAVDPAFAAEYGLLYGTSRLPGAVTTTRAPRGEALSRAAADAVGGTRDHDHLPVQRFPHHASPGKFAPSVPDSPR